MKKGYYVMWVKSWISYLHRYGTAHEGMTDPWGRQYKVWEK